ncbi:putative drug resistance transporter [Gordonia effusa NBRC 100432]|uniref:Putative drug resistance transporter n=2 Tax=Gordonia effusa TaxID=263908 RepID=H0R0H6_9ACTN|nr:MFS transporter [Gordonia effusa]GAB18577.1 putative drug resistance transporter [Gordonia effusa NBRC 100432]
MAVLLLPVLLVSIDNTVLSFALPQISTTLAPSSTQMLWIIDIYPLVLAALLVPMGSFADRFGRRRMLLLGGAGFAVVSVVAAFAPSAGALIATRAAMGIFGAMLMPSTLSLLRNIFTDRNERRFAIAIWAAGFAAGAALGPIVGGFLLEHFWWGSVFILAVPVLVPLLILGPIFLPESRNESPGPIDFASIAMVFVAMAALVFGIKEFATDGITASALAIFILGLAMGFLFVRRQLRLPTPMLDMSLFTRGAFSGAVLVNLLSVFALVGFLYFASQELQLVHGLSPMTAGLVLVPGLIGMVAAGLLSVPAVKRWRPVVVVCFGLGFSAVGYALIAGGTGSLVMLIGAFVVLAIGIGATETVSNDLIISAVPAEKSGAASAISETAYEFGAVLGTAVLGSILNAIYRSHLSGPNATAADTLGGAHQAAAQLPAEQANSLVRSANDAFASGVGVTAAIGAVLMVAAMGLAARMLREPRPSAE